MGGWAGLLLACCTPAGPERYEFDSKHMGTTVRVVLYAADRPAAEHAAKRAFARIAEVEQALSDYKPDSELMRLCKANDADPGKPRPVGEDLFLVFAAAQSLARQTDGAFDATVGPLVRLWRTARRTQQLPDPADLAAAKALVGYRKVTVDGQAKTVTLAAAGMRPDFGGIGKGYAADRALAVLKRLGATRALVAVAGDIACGDPPPGKPGWAVDVAPLAVGLAGDLGDFADVEDGNVRGEEEGGDHGASLNTKARRRHKGHNEGPPLCAFSVPSCFIPLFSI